MGRVGPKIVVAMVVAVIAFTPASVSAEPGDPCLADAPVEATLDVRVVDETAADAARNHLTGDVDDRAIDYLSPPGEPIEQSIDAAIARSGIEPAPPLTARRIARSTLDSLRRVNGVVGCADEGAGSWVEVQLTDSRLSFTGDPVVDPEGVDVASGYLLVTVTRLRTSRPVVEYAIRGDSPEPPTEPSVEPIEATPTFVG